MHLDRGAKENTRCSMCDKKEPDQGNNDELDGSRQSPKMQEMIPSDLLVQSRNEKSGPKSTVHLLSK